MKYKSLSLLIIVLFSACTIGAQNRKKVGIVLSGGGAKGVAHIGALKVIEEAGIPIDYVVGTSMGAIVGGLYSIGYTPQQLDSIVNAQDWKYLLSDALDPETTLLSEKLREEQYLLSVPIAGKSAHVSDAGIIKGRNISRLLSELTVGYHDSISFNRMPIPFACVSDNIVNGSKVVFHNGILATAMRASMSIPGVFAPVYLNGMVLVDGGLTDNYPVDIARQMGAEIIIGVDVQNPLMKADELRAGIEKLGLEADVRVPLSISVGVSFYPVDGTDDAVLLYKADKALYEAKKRGKNNCVIYSKELENEPFMSQITAAESE